MPVESLVEVMTVTAGTQAFTANFPALAMNEFNALASDMRRAGRASR